MKTLFLLVLLSQNGAGDINASFVSTETLDQCQQKALMVEGIFMSARLPVLEKRCITSKLEFSPFDHSRSTRQTRHFYLIHFDANAVNIELMEGWKACMLKAEEGVEQGKVYCSSSIQKLDQSTAQ
ncbi:MAG: hypothetical protein GY934_01620 [Gammaproteobacteria bacterium]|nr:hypothetical protein [Gammaproteobacteria bacterium]